LQHKANHDTLEV